MPMTAAVRRYRPAIATGAAMLAVVALIAGCSGSSPDQAAQAGASGDVPAATDQAVAPAASPSIAADAGDYLTSNCAVPAPGIESAQAPANGQALGAVTVTYDDQGVPQVTVGPQAGPVAELETLDLAVGDGAEVQQGDVITFNYCGVGMATRQIFDSSWARNEPLTYGLDELIPGWSAGLPGMKVGGQRLLVIPGDLGYGPEPNPASGILPDETLIFVVQVLGIGEES